MQRRTIELSLAALKRRRVEEQLRIRRATAASPDKVAQWRARVDALDAAIVELEAALEGTT